MIMNFDELNLKIDEYFDLVSPNDVVALFEKLGYEFEPKIPYLRENIVVKRIDFQAHANLKQHRANTEDHRFSKDFSSSIESIVQNGSTFTLARACLIEPHDSFSFEEADQSIDYTLAA